MVRGKQEASRGPRESFGRAWAGPSTELWEQWEDLGMVRGRAEEAMSDLSLRFSVFGGHRVLLAYVLACLGSSDALAAHLCSEIVQGPKALENVSLEGRILGIWCLGRGTFKDGI